MNSKSLLITVSGPDKPGITAGLMNSIVDSNFEIIDMGQSVTHGLLSLSILLTADEPDLMDTALVKELLFNAKKMGMQLDFKEVAPNSVQFRDGDKFILSCVSSQRITPDFICSLSNMLAGFQINILRIDNVNSGLNFRSLEISALLPVDLDLKLVKQRLMEISHSSKVDVAFLRENIYRRSKRLIVFDMDSTLIQTEVINEMARVHGVGEEIAEITERAMNGEIDFNESLIERVSRLEGLPVAELQKILNTLPLTPGVPDFIKTVKALGYKVALISGGFSYFAQALKNQLGLDYAFANELEVSGDKLTGKVQGTIINAEQKAMLIDLIAQQENISLDQVVAIGDGANDLPMLARAGLGIAFHAKDIVRREADHHMSYGPMTTILYFLGIRESEQVK